MSMYIVKNHSTKQSQKVYADNSMIAKKSVCSCRGWKTMECSVRMVTE